MKITRRSNRTEFGVVLKEVLVQLGLDVLAVGVLPQGGAVRPVKKKIQMIFYYDSEALDKQVLSKNIDFCTIKMQYLIEIIVFT